MAEPAVVLIPKCVECDQMWLPWDTARWQAYWIDDGPDDVVLDNGHDDVLLFYCADCAEREFGTPGHPE